MCVYITRAAYCGLCGMLAYGQAVECGVCDTSELWRGAAGLCARVRACAGAGAGAAKSVYVHTYTYIYINHTARATPTLPVYAMNEARLSHLTVGVTVRRFCF